MPLRPEDDHLRSLPQHRLSSRPGAWPPPAAIHLHLLSRLTARRNPQYRPASPTHHAADPIPAPVQECRGLLSPRALKPASTTRDAPSTSAPARHPPHACGEPNLLSSGGITIGGLAAARLRHTPSVITPPQCANRRRFRRALARSATAACYAAYSPSAQPRSTDSPAP
jgi:hypothetical protein